MKKILFISYISFAVLMMLVANMLPHHHHGDVVCMVIERCEKDNAINDEHTGHSQGDTDHLGGCCIIESDFVTTKTGNETRLKAPSCDDPYHDYSSPSLYTAPETLLSGSEGTSPGTEYGKHVSFRSFAETSLAHGLRAPPFLHKCYTATCLTNLQSNPQQ